MLIDGEEVIYSIEDDKVVYPEIPTEGLVCYLDARGKYNTDVYRNTLLDLSGNGNHGTLHNFSFTESSGYSAGGLKFDGVDDYLTISRDFTFTQKPFTYFVDFEISKTAMEQGGGLQSMGIQLGMGFYLHKNYNNNIFNYLTNNPLGNTAGSVDVTAGRHIFVCKIGEDFTTAKYFLDGNSVPVLRTLLGDGTPVVFMDKPGPIIIPVDGVKKINKLMIWDRPLTDEEITQLMEVE